MTREFTASIGSQIVAARLRQADLRVARRERLHRGLHHPRQRHHRRSSATASTSAPSTTSSTATPTCRSGDYQGLLMQGQLPRPQRPDGRRPLDDAAEERGRLRGRSGATSRAARRCSATTRRSSRRTRNFPIGRFDDFQRHKVRLWAVYNRAARPLRRARPVGDVAVQLGADLQPVRGQLSAHRSQLARRSAPATPTRRTAARRTCSSASAARSRSRATRWSISASTTRCRCGRRCGRT